MKIARGSGARPPLQEIKLGRGAVLKARTLDAFEHKMIEAEARSELNALVAGGETKRIWATLDGERMQKLQADESARIAALDWMHIVLLATACGVELIGVIDADTNEPLSASFETFELLFNDAVAERMFRMQMVKTELIWSQEKNVSGPGLNGPGPADMTTAPPADRQAIPAPQGDSEKSAAPAPSAQMPPEQPKASSHGISPPAGDAGNSSA